MDLSYLEEQGGFASSKLVKCSGKWRDDDVTFFVRHLPFGVVDKIFNTEGSNNSQSAELIAEGIRLGEDGEETMTYKQAYNLDAELATLFAEEIMRVNAVGDEEENTDPKASSQSKKPGSKSRSQSAARSKKQSKG